MPKRKLSRKEQDEEDDAIRDRLKKSSIYSNEGNNQKNYVENVIARYAKMFGSDDDLKKTGYKDYEVVAPKTKEVVTDKKSGTQKKPKNTNQPGVKYHSNKGLETYQSGGVKAMYKGDLKKNGGSGFGVITRNEPERIVKKPKGFYAADGVIKPIGHTTYAK